MTDPRPPADEWIGPDGLKRRREPSGKIVVLRGMVWREDFESERAEEIGIIERIDEWRKRHG